MPQRPWPTTCQNFKLWSRRGMTKTYRLCCCFFVLCYVWRLAPHDEVLVFLKKVGMFWYRWTQKWWSLRWCALLFHAFRIGKTCSESRVFFWKMWRFAVGFNRVETDIGMEWDDPICIYIYIDTCDWNIISFALQIELNSCVLFSLHLRVAVRTRSPSMFLSTRKQWNSLPLQCQLPSRWSVQWGRRTLGKRDVGTH